MSLNQVKEFVNYFNQTSLTKLEVSFDHGKLSKICLEKKNGNEIIKYQDSEIKNVTEESIVCDGHKVLSPLVGTFYSKPSPESDNYVKVGDCVAVGQILCIVEAMKVMNEITADKEGVIKAVLVKNEEMVEFDQPLFVIE